VAAGASSEGRRPPGRALRALAIAAALLALLFAIGYVYVRAFPRPDFPSQARPAGPAERVVPAPVLLVPRRDIEAGNAPLAIFVARRSSARTEVTIVFEDEDQPWPLGDTIYDLYRARAFGRVMDVETIGYAHEPPAVEEGDLRPSEIDLRDVYAQDQPFDVSFARHFDAAFPRERFEALFGRPVLRVATWNHMFTPGAPDEPPGAREGLVVVADLPVYAGTRAEVEAIFDAVREGRGR
jgi:hypothetical protein